MMALKLYRENTTDVTWCYRSRNRWSNKWPFQELVFHEFPSIT